MGRILFTLFFAFMVLLTPATSQVDTTSYSIGMSLGLRLQNQGANGLDYNSVIKGIQDVIDKNETLINRTYSDSINYIYFQNQRDNMFSNTKEEGAKFLAENAKRPEVTTTKSGLQYEILTAAEGPKPTATTTVTVHYVGKLLNGQMFDSSVDRESLSVFHSIESYQGGQKACN